MNKVILEGYLGHDPESRFTPDGAQWTKASLATSNDYEDESGQYVKKPESWHNIVCFGYPALVLAECRKGDIVHAEGEIQYDEWTDQNGNKRTGTKILCFVIEKKDKTINLNLHRRHFNA